MLPQGFGLERVFNRGIAEHGGLIDHFVALELSGKLFQGASSDFRALDIQLRSQQQVQMRLLHIVSSKGNIIDDSRREMVSHTTTL